MRAMATEDSPRATGERRRLLSALPSDFASWLVTAVATLVAYLLVGHGFMIVGYAWQIPLFVGAVAGLAASSALQGGVMAGVGVAVALIALPPGPAGSEGLGAAAWVLAVALALGAAYGVGALRSRDAEHRGVVDVWLAGTLVVWLLANLWAPLLSAGLPPSGYGALRATTLRAVPQPHTYANDDALYLRLYYLLHHGEGYYQAFRDAWLGLASGAAPPSSAASVRLPTLYWIWSALPPDPFSIAYLFLAFVSAGVVAAGCIAGQLAGSRFAPLASAALAAYAVGSAHTVYITYVDLPAMSVALVGVALFVRSRIRDDARYLWAAAVVITCAALMREILIYLTLLALLGASLDTAGKRLRSAAPWLVSLGVFAVGYAWHAVAVRGMMVAQSSTISYLKGSPSFALDSFRRFTEVMTGNGVLMLLLFLLAIAGAVGSRRRAGLPFAVFAAAALLAPLLTMLKVANPPVDATGMQVNYWGNLFMPLALALWPAWVLLLPGFKPSAK
jgi:hypothetical protein